MVGLYFDRHELVHRRHDGSQHRDDDDDDNNNNEKVDKKEDFNDKK